MSRHNNQHNTGNNCIHQCRYSTPPPCKLVLQDPMTHPVGEARVSFPVTSTIPSKSCHGKPRDFPDWFRRDFSSVLFSIGRCACSIFRAQSIDIKLLTASCDTTFKLNLFPRRSDILIKTLKFICYLETSIYFLQYLCVTLLC